MRTRAPAHKTEQGLVNGHCQTRGTFLPKRMTEGGTPQPSPMGLTRCGSRRRDGCRWTVVSLAVACEAPQDNARHPPPPNHYGTHTHWAVPCAVGDGRQHPASSGRATPFKIEKKSGFPSVDKEINESRTS